MTVSAESHGVIGVWVSATNYQWACDTIIKAAIDKRPLTVTALAVHGVMTGALSVEHRQRLNSLDMVLPDGQPVRWALNVLYRANLSDRVYGPQLMMQICERAAHQGLSIGLYGSRAEVLQDLCFALKERCPGLRVSLCMPSQFRRVSAEEQFELANKISRSGTDILFVGLGCPRQEIWLYEHRQTLPMPMIAVGAAFDFHATRIPQAPAWMQKRGLEWLFRLKQEPRRLWRRYLLLNPLFAALLALQALGLQRRHLAKKEVTFEGHA